VAMSYKQSQNPKEITGLRNHMRTMMPKGTLSSYLEIGSYAGESFEYMVPALKKGATVVLVDLGDNKAARQNLLEILDKAEKENSLKIHLVTGDSTDPLVISKVKDLCPPHSFDLCFIDGCHDFSYVVSDLANYSPLSSYVALHDIDPRCIQKQVEKHWFEKPCAAHVWSVLKLSRSVDEFIDADAKRPMGIGVLRGITIGVGN